MGDEGADDAPTGAAPTEIGSAVHETAAQTAWSLDDGEDWPTRRLTPAKITGMAVAGSVMIVAVASMVVWMAMRDRSEPPVTNPAPTSSVQPTTVVLASPSAPATSNQPPEQVTLPVDPYGQVHVRTLSGRTVCAMTAGDVQCNVHFNNQLGPIDNGMPASGIGINSRGAFQWLYGDPGDPEYVTMAYGTVYHAMGWIITPNSQGTTFMYDATGHGMTVSVDGFSTF